MNVSTKRLLSILLSLAMVLALLPMAVFAETATTLYVKPNSNWTQSNARFAAYFFGGSVGEKWVSMTDVGDGTYEAHLPEGYDYGCNIIFCRMRNGTSANSWTNKQYQIVDLLIPTDGKNLFTVNEGGDKIDGIWSVK